MGSRRNTASTDVLISRATRRSSAAASNASLDTPAAAKTAASPSRSTVASGKENKRETKPAASKRTSPVKEKATVKIGQKRKSVAEESEVDEEPEMPEDDAPPSPPRALRTRNSPINYSETTSRNTATNKRKDSTTDSPSSSSSSANTAKKRRQDPEEEARETAARDKEAREAQKKEKELEAVASVTTPTTLSVTKEEGGGYLRAGLYSADYRNGSTSGDKGKRKQDDAPFKIPLPMFWGETLLAKEKDFDLPYDLFHMYNTMGLAGDSEFDEIRVAINRAPPSKFEKIRRNIYVERKPRSGGEEWSSRCNCVKPADGSMGCADDTCLNRATFVECNPKNCPCEDKCANQRFQKSERVQELQVCQTMKRGHGLKTLVDIPEGTLIIEYRGEIISEDLCLDRMAVDKNAIYFLNYDTGEVVDANKKGTDARFINHSCDPNCQIEKWKVNGEFCIGVVALEDIKAGTELTYDYKFESVSDDMMKCHCGSTKCRGLIGENRRVEDDSRSRASGSAATSKGGKKEAFKPKKKAVNIERQWWLHKQKKDRLATSMREVAYDKEYFLLVKIFLLRNLRSAEKSLADPFKWPPPTGVYRPRRNTIAKIFSEPKADAKFPAPDLKGVAKFRDQLAKAQAKLKEKELKGK